MSVKSDMKETSPTASVSETDTESTVLDFGSKILPDSHIEVFTLEESGIKVGVLACQLLEVITDINVALDSSEGQSVVIITPYLCFCGTRDEIIELRSKIISKYTELHSKMTSELDIIYKESAPV